MAERYLRVRPPTKPKLSRARPARANPNRNLIRVVLYYVGLAHDFDIWATRTKKGPHTGTHPTGFVTIPTPGLGKIELTKSVDAVKEIIPGE